MTRAYVIICECYIKSEIFYQPEELYIIIYY